MPVYIYEHERKGRSKGKGKSRGGAGCALGEQFEMVQPVSAEALVKCPECGGAVHRVICPPLAVRSPRSDSDLKSLGFTKLVRRDKGVYENVTATDGESRIVEAGKPKTMPHLKKKIRD